MYPFGEPRADLVESGPHGGSTGVSQRIGFTANYHYYMKPIPFGFSGVARFRPASTWMPMICLGMLCFDEVGREFECGLDDGAISR
jgi:hypothetical protein